MEYQPINLSTNQLLNYSLHLADNALILAQRNSEWCGHGPVLEQDIAITNISLDILGQARNFYQYAATLINELQAPSPLERAGGEVIVTNEKATEAELKILHKAIKKIEEDTERFSYNTAVSAFMVCVNELADLKCSKKEILEPLVIMLSSYAPHIAEELYHSLTPTLSTSGEGAGISVLDATYPSFNQQYLIESTKEYPISINGKLRTTLKIALDAQENQVEEMVLQNDVVQKWLDGKPPKKIIFVKGKMVNVVI